jgi:HAD superfamily hydrolase (TIGR01549 family)
MRTQAVFLDLDATLLDYDGTAWAQTVRAVCAALPLPDGIDRAELARTYTEVSTRHFLAAEQTRQAPADGHAIWRTLWREALTACGAPADGLVSRATAEYERDRAARYRLYDDVRPTLARLRERVSALVLITNGMGTTQRHKADATGLTGLLDAVVISGEVGVSKPDPGIFEIAARAAEVPLAAAWHVGDSLGADVAGAANAHLGASVWLNRRGAALAAGPRPDFQISALSELPALLDR